MDWRCKWCGKPHAENDPPCDNCGHGRFEKAVVQMGPDSTDDATQVVWVCTECGREHQKHSPPCSRCGNATLEQREADYSDLEEIGETGWLDILDRRHAAGFAVAGVLALVLGLGVVGVVDLPGLGGPPSPPDAPGENETASGVSLADVEASFVATINTRRADEDARSLEYGETVDTMATYYNKRVVESRYGGADPLTRSELDPFDPACGDSSAVALLHREFAGPNPDTDVSADGGPSAESYGSALAIVFVETADRSFGDPIVEERGLSAIGVDIHADPQGEFHVTVGYC